MASIDYLFNGSNIGPKGIFKDGQNVPEMMYMLTKKMLGRITREPDTIYTSELGGSYINNTPNSFQYIKNINLYSQLLPLSNPIAFTPLNPLNSINSTKISDWSNYYNFQYINTQLLTENISSKYISKVYPYIAFYSNLLLTPLTLNNNTKYIDCSYAHPLLVNQIEFTYDRSYSPTVTCLNSITVDVTASTSNLNTNTVTYTAINSFVIGQFVTVNNIPSPFTRFNINYIPIIAATSTNFTVFANILGNNTCNGNAYVYSSNTYINLTTTNGYWIIDPSTGILTFYDNNSVNLNRYNPPRISFYRYEGLFGDAAILQGQDL